MTKLLCDSNAIKALERINDPLTDQIKLDSISLTNYIGFQFHQVLTFHWFWLELVPYKTAKVPESRTPVGFLSDLAVFLFFKGEIDMTTNIYGSKLNED